jgi:prepilin-type N-terminal cleavage/methylation domain-containing protein
MKPILAWYNEKNMRRSSPFDFPRRQGFTLVEVLISVAIFTVVIVAFITMFVAIANVQVGQSSTSVVSQESQFLLEKLQYYVESASIIQIPQDTPTSTLTLYMASSSLDPTYITLATGTVYLQQSTSGPLQALSSNRVAISNLSFTRRANPPGHDSVSISFTISYNASNLAQGFSQMFQTSISEVSAATFDTGVYPSVSGIEPLGGTGALWSSINGVINFSGNNVGIGTAAPEQTLEVNGGIRLNPGGSQPTCSSSTNSRGTLWFAPGGAGKDSLYLCATNASGTYGWQQLY